VQNDIQPSSRSLRGLDWLNFFLADVQTGVGPFLAAALTARKWNPEQVGIVLTVGGLVGIAVQGPAGAVAQKAGFSVSFLLLGGIAVAAFVALAVFVPETRKAAIPDAVPTA
jgi:hypothetical protein